MFRKSLLPVLLLFLLIDSQVCSSTTFSPNDGMNNDSESKIILELIKNALEAINNISTDILTSIREFFDKLHDSAQPITEFIRDTLSRAIAEINQALVAYIQEVKKNHTEIEGFLDCLLDQDDNLTVLFNSALNTTMQCTKDQLQLFTDDINDVLNDFLILNFNVSELEIALPDCQNTTLVCLEEFLSNVEGIWKQLEQKILNDLGTAVEFIWWFKDNFLKCSNLGYDVMDEGGFEIYQQVVQCAKNKFANN